MQYTMSKLYYFKPVELERSMFSLKLAIFATARGQRLIWWILSVMPQLHARP